MMAGIADWFAAVETRECESQCQIERQGQNEDYRHGQGQSQAQGPMQAQTQVQSQGQTQGQMQGQMQGETQTGTQRRAQSRSSLQQIVLYTVAGLALIAAGAFLGFTSSGTLFLLLLLTAVHGIIFGALTLRCALRLRVFNVESFLMYAFGSLSIVLAGWMVWMLHGLDDRAALGLVGAYLLLVGAKLLFFAGDTRYRALHGGEWRGVDGEKDDAEVEPL